MFRLSTNLPQTDLSTKGKKVHVFRKMTRQKEQ